MAPRVSMPTANFRLSFPTSRSIASSPAEDAGQSQISSGTVCRKPRSPGHGVDVDIETRWETSVTARLAMRSSSHRIEEAT